MRWRSIVSALCSPLVVLVVVAMAYGTIGVHAQMECTYAPESGKNQVPLDDSGNPTSWAVWLGGMGEGWDSYPNADLTMHRHKMTRTRAGGDVNGDGFGDLVIGLPTKSSNQGELQIWYGPVGLGVIGNGWSEPDQTFRHNAAGQNGYFAAYFDIGDADNDGKDDIICSAPQADSFPPFVFDDGRLFIIWGSNAWPGGVTLLPDAAYAHSWQTAGTGGANWDAVWPTFIGDINSDGFADFIVGNQNYLAGRGKATIVYGRVRGSWSSGSFIAQHAAYSWNIVNSNSVAYPNVVYFCDFAALGDVNGDTYPDFALTWCQEAGSTDQDGVTAVVFGKSNADAIADWAIGGTLEMPGTDEDVTIEEGFTITGGDWNGDGYSDIVIGDPREPGVHLIFGNALPPPYNTTGRVMVFFGSATMSGVLDEDDADMLIRGNHFDYEIGWTVDMGDVNDDGLQDILIGRGNDVPGVDTGNGYLIPGRIVGYSGRHNLTRSMIAGALTDVDLTLYSILNDDTQLIGRAISSVGDITGDGIDDVAIMAPMYSSIPSFAATGAIFFIPGFTMDDLCDSNPCLHSGTCTVVEADLDYHCDCVDGWHGHYCQTDDNDCASDPCLNFGECEEGLGANYTCNCDGTDYVGAWCQIPVDQCASSPCMNLADPDDCQDLLFDFRCFCDSSLGYAGPTCEDDFNECDLNPCGFGTCTDTGLLLNFTCDCDDGYLLGEEGTCFDFDDCASDPCKHGGRCSDVGWNKFNCFCEEGWFGKTCEDSEDDCASDPCLNNGVCLDTGVDSFNCTCDGFQGDICEVDINDCLSNPCKHGGKCKDPGLKHAYFCDCFGTGYQGDTCQNEVDECLSDPCNDRGPCTDGDAVYHCACDAPDVCEPGIGCHSNAANDGTICDNEPPFATKRVLQVTEDIDEAFVLEDYVGDDDAIAIFTLTEAPSHGRLICNTEFLEEGDSCRAPYTQMSFRPSPDFSGSDAWKVDASDAAGAETTDIYVDVQIKSIDDAPFFAGASPLAVSMDSGDLGVSIVDPDSSKAYYWLCLDTDALAEVNVSITFDGDFWQEVSGKWDVSGRNASLPLEFDTHGQGGFYLEQSHVMAGVVSSQNSDLVHLQQQYTCADLLNPALSNQTGAQLMPLLVQCASGLHNNVWSTGSVCKACPGGAVCSLTGDTLPANEAGFWRSADATDAVFVECRPAEACLATTGECATGYKGFACGECANNYYLHTGRCYPCDGISVWTIVLGVVIVLCVIAACVFLATKGEMLQVVVPCVTTFLQTLVVFSSLPLRWSPLMLDMFQGLGVFQLDADLLSLECSLGSDMESAGQYILKFCMVTLFPVVLGTFMLVIHLLNKHIVSRFNFHRMQKVRDAMIKGFMIFIVFMYFPIVAQVLAFFDCTERKDGSSTLDAAPALRCRDDWWWSMFPYAFFCLIVYVIGIPAVCTYVLRLRPRLKNTRGVVEDELLRGKERDYFRLMRIFTSNKDVEYPESKAVEYQIAFKKWETRFDTLFMQYSVPFYFWEIMIMLRKLALGLCMMFFNNLPVTQAASLVIVLVMCLLIQRDYRPYSHAEVDYLESVTLGASVFLLFFGLLLTGDKYDATSGDVIGVLAVLVLVCCLALILYTVWRLSNASNVDDFIIKGPHQPKLLADAQLEDDHAVKVVDMRESIGWGGGIEQQLEQTRRPSSSSSPRKSVQTTLSNQEQSLSSTGNNKTSAPLRGLEIRLHGDLEEPQEEEEEEEEENEEQKRHHVEELAVLAHEQDAVDAARPYAYPLGGVSAATDEDELLVAAAVDHSLFADTSDTDGGGAPAPAGRIDKEMEAMDSLHEEAQRHTRVTHLELSFSDSD